MGGRSCVAVIGMLLATAVWWWAIRLEPATAEMPDREKQLIVWVRIGGTAVYLTALVALFFLLLSDFIDSQPENRWTEYHPRDIPLTDDERESCRRLSQYHITKSPRRGRLFWPVVLPQFTLRAVFFVLTYLAVLASLIATWVALGR